MHFSDAFSLLLFTAIDLLCTCICLSSDWLIGLSVSVLIGQSIFFYDTQMKTALNSIVSVMVSMMP